MSHNMRNNQSVNNPKANISYDNIYNHSAMINDLRNRDIGSYQD